MPFQIQQSLRRQILNRTYYQSNLLTLFLIIIILFLIILFCLLYLYVSQMRLVRNDKR